MLVGASDVASCLTEAEVQAVAAEALARADLAGKRVLVIIPDRTRTAPVPLLFRLFQELLGQRTAELDFLVALGTHPLMDDPALSRLVGVSGFLLVANSGECFMLLRLLSASTKSSVSRFSGWST